MRGYLLRGALSLSLRGRMVSLGYTGVLVSSVHGDLLAGVSASKA